MSDPSKSPFVRVTKARKVKVELDRKVRYELDGGDRSKVRNFKVKVEAGALRIEIATQHTNIDALSLYQARGYAVDTAFAHLSLPLVAARPA